MSFKNGKIKLCIAIIAMFLGTSSISYGQFPMMLSDADSLIRQGADYIYNLEFSKAEDSFKKVRVNYPHHPAGYFLDAMIEWWKILIYPDTRQYDNIFLNKIQNVIDICDGILDTASWDIKALFFKGGALGYRGRFYALRDSWFRAANDGHTGLNILIEAQKLAPVNHDLMLGLGLYNYFAVAFPDKYPAIKPLMLFVPKGDKEIGILQLRAASKHARYSATEAKVVLLQIYYQFEKNYTEALAIAEDLYNSYPNNPYFHRYLGRCHVVNGLATKYEETWREILNRYVARMPGYDNRTAREALYYIGVALTNKRQWDTALRFFLKSDDATRIVDDEITGFRVATFLRIGRIYDIKGEREKAIEYYNQLLKWKDVNNSHNEARTHLKTPYRQ